MPILLEYDATRGGGKSALLHEGSNIGESLVYIVQKATPSTTTSVGSINCTCPGAWRTVDLPESCWSLELIIVDPVAAVNAEMERFWYLMPRMRGPQVYEPFLKAADVASPAELVGLPLRVGFAAHPDLPTIGIAGEKLLPGGEVYAGTAWAGCSGVLAGLLPGSVVAAGRLLGIHAAPLEAVVDCAGNQIAIPVPDAAARALESSTPVLTYWKDGVCYGVKRAWFFHFL